jgi:putative FmdB family regulatory protein
MPIYEFECDACGARFEELVRSGAAPPPCPSCGAVDVRRLLSQVFPTPRIGLRGADARRATAQRRADKERKREQQEGNRR